MKKFCKDCRWYLPSYGMVSCRCMVVNEENLFYDPVYGEQYKEIKYEDMIIKNKNFDCPDYEEKEE